jgi:hypothetical protein
LRSAVFTKAARQPAMKLGKCSRRECVAQKNKIHMNSKLTSKLKHLVAALTVIVFVAVASLGHLAAQSAVTLPMKVDSDINGMSVELTAVQKTGDTIMVRFKYSNSSDKNVTMYDHIGGYVEDKIYYVDAKNKKKYPVVRDSESNPLSSNLHNVTVNAGETKNCWAKFPAPPSDVTAISVYIPGAPPFENVPIAQ